jgi:hypothetical protein
MFRNSVRTSQETLSVSAGFEFSERLTVKSTVFWDVTPCNPVEVHRRFGGTVFIFSAEE